MLKLTDGDGIFTVRTAGVAGKLSAAFDLTVGPVDFSAHAVAIEVNTMPEAVSATFGALTLDVPAGPFLQVRATGLQFSVQDQAFAADALFRQQTGELTITATNVSATIGSATGVRLVLRNGAGELHLNADGVWGSVSGIVELLGVDGVAFRASLKVTFDTRPASATLRVEGDVAVAVGQPDGTGGVTSFAEIAGAFVFEQLTAAGPSDPVLRATATDVHTFVGTPGVLGLDVSGGSLPAARLR